jgi:hypothetical protein
MRTDSSHSAKHNKQQHTCCACVCACCKRKRCRCKTMPLLMAEPQDLPPPSLSKCEFG